MGFFNKVLKAAMPKTLGNPIAIAISMVSVALSVVKGKKAKKVTKGSKKATVKKVKLYQKNKNNKWKLDSEFINRSMVLTSEELPQ